MLIHRNVRILRHSPNGRALNSPIEKEKQGLRIVLTDHLRKPVLMLASVSILLAITAYMSFAHGILYLVLETYPVSFVDRRYWPLRLSGLPSLTIIVEVCIGCLIDFTFTRTKFQESVRKYGRLCPEERLLPIPEVNKGVPLGIGIRSDWPRDI